MPAVIVPDLENEKCLRFDVVRKFFDDLLESFYVLAVALFVVVAAAAGLEVEPV